MGGKKIDLGLPSFNQMMKGKGRGFTLLPVKKAGKINNGIRQIDLGLKFQVPIKKPAPAKTSRNDLIGLGDSLKKPKQLIRGGGFQNVTLPKPTPLLRGNLDENIRPSAEAIRKQSFDKLNQLRGQGLQQEGTGKEITTDADKFAFGIQNKPVRDQSVISNRKFQFVTLQDGVLQKKEFRDKELAEGQRRLAEAQGIFESVSQVREIRI